MHTYALACLMFAQLPPTPAPIPDPTGLSQPQPQVLSIEKQPTLRTLNAADLVQRAEEEAWLQRAQANEMKSRNPGFQPQSLPGYGSYGPFGYAYPGQGYRNYGVSPAFGNAINAYYQRGTFGPLGYGYPGQGYSSYGVSPAFGASINESYMHGRGYGDWGPYGYGYRRQGYGR